MFHGMYEHKDEYDNLYHLNAKIGGFKTQEQAAKAVRRRSPTGYITDSNNTVLCVIRNGQIVKYER